MIYLDNSATTRVLPQAADAAAYYMREAFFNPSSAYNSAASVERTVNAARARLASLLAAAPEEILYTSGGTESNNMAILGALKAMRAPKALITSAVEHPSVLQVFQELERSGMKVIYFGVDSSGSVRMEELRQAVTRDTSLVSIMQVNNETGAVNDITGAYELIRRTAPEAVFHVDGVQGFCKLPFGRVPADLYSISGHKFHSPKGVGALYVRRGLRFAGGLMGGGQERNLRSGTTNVPGIMGMDAALEEYRAKQEAHIAHLRACKLRLAQNLMRIPQTVVNGPAPEEGAPHILNVSFLGVRGEVLLHALEQNEIYVSTGSACSSHKKGKNRVLNAMGVVGERQEGALRFSLCPYNTLEEMDKAFEAIAEHVAQLRRFKRR